MKGISSVQAAGEPSGLRDHCLREADRASARRADRAHEECQQRIDRTVQRFQTLFPDRIFGIDLDRETVTCDGIEFSSSRISASAAYPTTDLCVITDCTCGIQVSAGIVRNAATAGEAIRRIDMATELRAQVYEQGRTDVEASDLLLCGPCQERAAPELAGVDTTEDRLAIALRDAVLGWIREDARR